MARVNIEQIDAPAYADRSPARVELRRGNVVRAYLLRLLYSFTVTGGTGQGNIFSDAHFRLLKRLQFRVGGNDVISVRGQFLRLLHLVMGTEEHVQTPPANLAEGTQAGRELLVELPLYMMHSLFPDVFAAPTGAAGFPTPELVVTWGDADDMVTGQDATSVAIASPRVELYEVFHEPPVSLPTEGWQALRMATYTRDITQTGPVKLQFPELEPGDEIRAVFVEAFSGGVSGSDYVYDDAVVETLRLSIGGRAVRERVPLRVVQQENRRTYALDAIIEGVAVLDSAEDRDTRPGRLWTVVGRQTPTLEIEATKQAGDCQVVATVIYTRGRLAAQ